MCLWVFAVAFMSCRHVTVSQKLDKVEAMLENGNLDDVRKQCDVLYTDMEAANAVDVEDLCRLAKIYLYLADNDGSRSYDDDIASATGLYMKALEIKGDSVSELLDMAYQGDGATIELIRQLSVSSGKPLEIFEEYQPSDSINFPEHQHENK